ncbi:5-formyltetrahydrofolate cyclo-ligase [Sporanaerobium hydrogeniformans]|uniref:5-formyltetrahydrofolate cyclo-ligase n=1 Tax=Sporanaerobium hydrogeniformans TaxID=3072179 RepID=UPI0015D4EDA3|nr:5-formyltetrahydrofolate cyclo-ligase [Sporanaerobium hydrogeniformans]
MINKLSIRQSIREQRKRQEQAEIEWASKQITEKLKTLEAYQNATKILSYAAMPLEIQTSTIHQKAREEGKQVAYPLMGPNEGEMTFYEVDRLEELEVHYYGSLAIKEPNPSCHTLIIPSKGDIMLVPGLAFDRKGGRIGYGGGFYDRYLIKYPFLYTIGVGQKFQLLETVPMEETDQLLKALLISDKSWGCEEIQVI